MSEISVVSEQLLKRVPSLAEQTYKAIKDRIIQGAIEPGEPLSENQLARQFSISRSPLREAIRRLQDEGLLDASGPRGFSVPPITPEYVANLYQARQALESSAAATATDIPAEALWNARVELEKIEGDLEEGKTDSFTKSDFRFHDLYLKSCGNPILLHMIDHLRGPVQRVHVYAGPLLEHMRASFREHQLVLECMERGDTAALAAAVSAHTSGVSQRLQAALRAEHA